MFCLPIVQRKRSMSKAGLVNARRLVLVAGLAVLGAGWAAPAPAAAKKAAGPNETPVTVVASAASAQAALEKVRASGQALVADLTLGHEGQIVRAKTAAPLSPGRYRLHALVASTGQDTLFGEDVVLRVVAGESRCIFAPTSWFPEPGKLSPVYFDFIVDKPGQMAIAADWSAGDAAMGASIQPYLAKRQNAINQLKLKDGPGKKSEPAADDAGLGDAVDDLLDDEPQAKEALRLTPRGLAGNDLPPYRLLLAGLMLERLSPVTKVRFDGRECAVAYTRLGRPVPPLGLSRSDGRDRVEYFTPGAAFAGFDLTQPGNVEIECAGPVQSVHVRPASLGIRPNVSGNTITLPLQAPASLSVEINADSSDPLFLFADPPEEAPRPNTPGVKFFAAGKVHDAGNVAVKSGETVYIERGAVVRGSFVIDDVKNVKILGRGVLDGGLVKPDSSRTIEISRAEDVVVEGITILDSRHWAIPILRSDRVTIRRVKIISDNPADDGVVVVGSRDVTVEKCFIRTKDSCVAIKAGGVTYFTPRDCQRDVENVVVRDCVLWSGSRGNGLQILTRSWLADWVGKETGFEPRVTQIRKIRFTNNDLIHGDGPAAAVAIHNGDSATVDDVIYEDLRLESLLGPVVDFRIRPTPDDRDAAPGHIRNIVLRAIRAEGAHMPASVLAGFDETHRIEGVVFENVHTAGAPWTKLEPGTVQAEFTTGVEFR